MRRRFIAGVTSGALTLALALVGCERAPTPTQTVTIPIKVWVVLGPGEQVGGQSNKGCRLTVQEITD
jgi:hypothetical protein